MSLISILDSLFFMHHIARYFFILISEKETKIAMRLNTYHLSLIFITDFYLYLGRKEIWNLVFYETTTRQIHGFAQAFSARLSYMEISHPGSAALRASLSPTWIT